MTSEYLKAALFPLGFLLFKQNIPNPFHQTDFTGPRVIPSDELPGKLLT